ncbi:MAG: S-layer homology domain-containing protein [Candidatus Pristimantibacillus lignocellulolyticus]|uniref:S-layer homology domain-containing protein n=1 Tax=Candidatus Pristimantibacillus lignocellulolyticus TaxID=2994561 RepID=A0A9J6ZG58_9BACL|nr:MAG: S-layer homology domain-containing protein [Candidatus Pristimantibacillus lignocellulolyticus]
MDKRMLKRIFALMLVFIIVTGSTNGTRYTITVKASNEAGSNSLSTVTVSVVPPILWTPTTPGIVINGVEVNNRDIAMNDVLTTSNTNVNGQSVITITFDQLNIEEYYTAIENDSIMTVSTANESDVYIVELNGQIVKDLKNKRIVLEFNTKDGIYKLPLEEIDIDAIAQQIGKAIILSNIKLQIEIATLTEDELKNAELAAAQVGFKLVIAPIDFTVRATHGDRAIDIISFNNYVERAIALPARVSANNVTTAVVIDPSGKVYHVPTKVELINGNNYAVINSATNSMYAIISNQLEFEDMSNHWAKNAVNNLGSRLVIDEVDNSMFNPDQDITRAEFAAVIVRGLGLKLDDSIRAFSDVTESDWYNNAIQTAFIHNLTTGFNDASFRPNDNITREEAMVIIARAMTITKLNEKLTEQPSAAQIGQFTDTDEVSSWAVSSIEDTIQVGIVSGRTSTKLVPKGNMTRAEAATIIERLLQKSDLI